MKIGCRHFLVKIYCLGEVRNGLGVMTVHVFDYAAIVVTCCLEQGVTEFDNHGVVGDCSLELVQLLPYCGPHLVGHDVSVVIIYSLGV
ncbi:hypothetical protein CT0135 [Chlorobaculum tepidum TLS]|uniref:Uncharacterized protein n=1 Tax=Chlorobaculum tepidum (strain ATCC 49652 / DSM 12025 / NBRC 103806 / TLS) TaxID=194439 RepID=Q8KG33_CHLTE|nr:hypothetical protein CT0135 [Chlorobaculum tepidum TLS]